MGRYVRDLWEFIIGAWGALGLAALSFVDPLKALEAIGVDLNLEWSITPDQRRAIFLALAFVWMFVWFSRARHRFEIASFQPSPNMPFHMACRWIARDSVWAANFDPADDGRWVSLVYNEFMSKMMMGRFQLFGERRPPNGSVQPLSHMVSAFKEVAAWDASKLATSEPPSHMWATVSGGEVYYQVMVDKAEIMKVWPRKSLFSRLKRRSPVERFGGYDYGGKFAEQDLAYNSGKREMMPLNAIMGWASEK